MQSIESQIVVAEVISQETQQSMLLTELMDDELSMAAGGVGIIIYT
ncbi:hypothetical protein BH10PSE17_BH10PSE17_29080 [soil metagenome]